jgi:glycosyltransferase involved in cell wall biosynthesis
MKGGDLVLQVAQILRNRGINAIVDIVGCIPDQPVPDYVQLHGFISKTADAGAQKLHELLLDARYLFVPSFAECYGLVFAEASAYGLPSLARATGGIPSVVKNGQNGWAFGMEVGPQAYADYIQAGVSTYSESAHRARRCYEEWLNWETAIDCLEAEITLIIAKK